MGLNTSIYAALSNSELAALETSVYNGCMRLFQASSDLYGDMAEISPMSPAYPDMGQRARVLLSAGREQNDLHREITAEMRDRQALRNARPGYPLTRPLVSTRDASGDMTPAELREFEANWTAE